MADVPDSNPPASEVNAGNDLLSPADHHALGHAYIDAAHEALGHAGEHFTAAAPPDDQPGEEADDGAVEIGPVVATPATADDYLAGALSTAMAPVATAKARSFPGSAQQRSHSLAPGAARTAAAMKRGRPS